MTARKAERIAIENAVSPGRVVQVDAAKYGNMKRAVMTVLTAGQPSLTVAERKAQVLPLLSDALFPGGDKAGWWLKAVNSTWRPRACWPASRRGRSAFIGHVEIRRQLTPPTEAVGEVSGQHVRFVAMDLLQATGLAAVAPPVLEITSDTVERALRDAERLLATEGATSGVDRIHTAFRGYLRALASRANLGHSDTAGVTELFRLIRVQHPSFAVNAAHQAEIDKILRALANVVDTLNPLRNQGSVAHPNVDLLAEPEAMLFMNCVRCLLHYMNAKTKM